MAESIRERVGDLDNRVARMEALTDRLVEIAAVYIAGVAEEEADRQGLPKVADGHERVRVRCIARLHELADEAVTG